MRSAVGVHAAELQNTDPPMNSAIARRKSGSESASLKEPESSGCSRSVRVANPVELQQHVRRGDDTHGRERGAPARRRDDPARQHGADGAADAVGNGHQAGREPTAIGQQIGHERIKRRRCEAVTDAGDSKKNEKQDRLGTDPCQTKTGSKQTQTGDQYGFAPEFIGEAAGDTAREGGDDHHDRKQAARGNR